MTTATATPVATGTWTADPVHSTAEFAVKHMVVATFRGSFAEIDATLDLASDTPTLRGSVPVASIVVKDENLKGHLLSPDFFDAENAPNISFASDAVERGAGNDVTVRGSLTVKNATHPVVLTGSLSEPIEHFAGGERIALDLTTAIDRTVYGLDWNAPLPKGGFALGNDVTLSVHLELQNA